MNRVVYLLASFVSLSLLTAQNAPAQTKAVKDGKGVCQILVPGDWQVDSDLPGMVRDPKGTLSVSVVWEVDYTVKPMSEMAIKSNQVDKMYENTAQRIFYQGKTVDFFSVPSTSWTVFTPAPQKGACHCVISGKPGESEQAVKSIAMTLGPAK